MIIKCKYCGGDINFADGSQIATCEYCGSTNTVPRIEDEKRLNLFNRGNFFRMKGDYGQAQNMYSRIIEEDATDAEAHWCLALSRFGIEYVEDPTTYEWIPTCHRLSYDSFLDDIDYQEAIKNADGLKQRQYVRDANRINQILNDTLAVVKNEQPYDIFISYKETDAFGERTQDSVIAQNLYDRLTDKGYRVFFSRISLEDKLGTQYEPYIFSALNSAKIMLTVCTTPENINSVWVKNEWSRYLDIMKNDRSKKLIPCYKDMDPYSLPEELALFQGSDLGKLGADQDLIHAVGKYIGESASSAVSQNNSNPDKFLSIGYMYLSTDPSKAMTNLDLAVGEDPSCFMGYVGLAAVAENEEQKETFLNAASMHSTGIMTDREKSLIPADAGVAAKLLPVYLKLGLPDRAEYLLNNFGTPAGFESPATEEIVWKCDSCGYEYIGAAPKGDGMCPVCRYMKLKLKGAGRSSGSTLVSLDNPECFDIIMKDRHPGNLDLYMKYHPPFARKVKVSRKYSSRGNKTEMAYFETDFERILIDYNNISLAERILSEATANEKEKLLSPETVRHLAMFASAECFGILKNHGADLNYVYTDKTNRSETVKPLLFYVAEESDKVNELIALGADPRKTCIVTNIPGYPEEYTLLMTVVRWGKDAGAVETIISSGADINRHVDSYGFDPAFANNAGSDGRNKFNYRHMSVMTDLVWTVRDPVNKARILLSHGADPNEWYEYEGAPNGAHERISVLAEYCRMENPSPEVVKMLVQAGADVNAECSYEDNRMSMKTCLLDNAVSSKPGGRPEVVKVLLEAGANPNSSLTFERKNVPVNKATVKLSFKKALLGRTLETEPILHRAILNDAYEVTKLLLEHGASWKQSLIHDGKQISLLRYPYDRTSKVSSSLCQFIRQNGWKGGGYF